VVVLFGVSAARLPSGTSRTCAGRCPVDCPMHAKRLGCHHGGNPASAAHDCHRRPGGGPGFRAAGCQHGPDGLANSLQPAILPHLLDLHDAPLGQRYVVNDLAALAMVIVEPPFRPPPTLVCS